MFAVCMQSSDAYEDELNLQIFMNGIFSGTDCINSYLPISILGNNEL